MKVSITGASGFVGRRLVDALHSQGHEIAVLCRSRDKAFQAGVRVVIGDLTGAAHPLRELLTECDAVFHCAGQVRDAGAMRAVHVDGTRNLLDALCAERGAGGVHWVQLSSVGINFIFEFMIMHPLITDCGLHPYHLPCPS